MIRRTNGLHLEGRLITAKYTGTTTEAFLRVKDGLELLAAIHFDHLDGVKEAAVQTVLAAVTVPLIDIGHVAALLPDKTDVKAGLVYGDGQHAAVTAALAGKTDLHTAVILPLVEEAIILYEVIQFQGFLYG